MVVATLLEPGHHPQDCSGGTRAPGHHQLSQWDGDGGHWHPWLTITADGNGEGADLGERGQLEEFTSVLGICCGAGK